MYSKWGPWYVRPAPEQCMSGLGRLPSRPPPMDPRHVPNTITRAVRMRIVLNLKGPIVRRHILLPDKWYINILAGNLSLYTRLPTLRTTGKGLTR